jgi:uncharacterized protein involved in outer membrane biogenesis
MNFLQGTWRRRLGWIGAVAVSLGALVTLGSLALAPLLKAQTEIRASAALGRTVTLGDLVLHPWSLTLAVSDLKVAGADSVSTQFALGGLTVQASIESLWRLAPVLDALRIEHPQVHLTRLANGHYDIDDLLQRFAAPAQAPESAASTVHFALYNVELIDGAIDLVDHSGSGARTHTLRKLQLSVPFLSNLESQREVRVQPRLAFELNGATFDTNAQATPFAAARQGEVQLHMAGLDLAPYLAYLPAQMPVQLRGAVLGTDLQIKFAQTPKAQLSVTGTVQVSKLRLADAGGDDFLQLESLHAELGDVRPLEQYIGLKALTLTQPHLALARHRDGRLNLESATAPPAARATAPGPVAAPWTIALEHLALKQAQVRWRDERVAPAADWVFEQADLDVKNIHWPMAASQAAAFAGAFSLSAGANPADKPARVQFEGMGTLGSGSAKATLCDLGLPLAAPYLANYLVPSVRGTASAELAAQWGEAGVTVHVPQAAVRDFSLRSADLDASTNAKQMPSFKALEVQEVALDLSARSVRVGKLALHAPVLRVQRESDGQWAYARWLKPQPSAAPTPAWTVQLANVLLDGGSVTLVDHQPVKTAYLGVSGLNVQAQNLSLDGKQPAPLHVRANVRSGPTDPGSLKFDGSVMWSPVRAQGNLELVDFPGQFAAPYLMEQMHVELMRADVNFKGPVRFANLPTGMSLQVHGDGALEDFQANSFQAIRRTADAAGQPATTEGSEELLNWKVLSLPGIDLALQPGAPLQLRVGEVALTDFFARLIVNAEGRLVLQDLVTAPAPAPQAAVPHDSATDPVIEFGPVQVANGRVAFSDRFIKPNYSAELSDLSGSLGRVSTRSQNGVVASADLALHGRAEGSALLEVTGRVNPLARPIDLDIHAKVSDLELSPLSSYAIKYAGYGVERGKLSADLSYLVQPDGQLTASNHIVLNQLTFGNAVPDAPASLPVKLVTALLSDRDGVINLNLPVSGSLNDPQFSIGPVIWKMLGNLIVKAMTSPFSLFSMGSGGSADEEIGAVTFQPGTAQLSESGRHNLDRIAAELRERPALQVTIVGTASLEAEAGAIRQNRLHALLLAEKRRAAGSSAQEVQGADEISEVQYPALLKAVYKHSDIKKPRNLLGLPSDLPVAQMQALLLDSMAVNADTVHALAFARSIAVRDYLSASPLPTERLFLGEEKIPAGTENWMPQAELSLSHH